MRSLVIVLGLFVLGQYVFAGENAQVECAARLTSNFNRDSVGFSFDRDDVAVEDYGTDHLAQARSYIRYALKTKGCSKTAVDFSKGPLGKSRSMCREVVEDLPHSESCYVETNLGYFFVSYDMLTRVHIIFNRWD